MKKRLACSETKKGIDEELIKPYQRINLFSNPLAARDAGAMKKRLACGETKKGIDEEFDNQLREKDQNYIPVKQQNIA